MPAYTRIPSLSTALEQERLELLQEVHDQRKSSARRSSPATRTTTSTAPPARNTVGDHNGPSAPSARTAPLPGELPPRHGSIAGIGVGVTPPSGRRNNGFDSSPASALRNTTSTTDDPPSSPSTTQSATTTTATAPPPLPKPKTTTSSAPPPLEQPARRRASDQSSSDKSVEPKLEHRPRPSIRWDDSVSMSPSASGHGGARRSSQQSQEKPANRALPGKNAMAAVMSGLDLRVNLPSFTRGRDSSRSSTRRGTSLDSKFSTPRFARSSSPRNRMISPSNTRTPPASSSLAKSSTETPKAPEVGKTTEVENGDKSSKLPAHQEEPEHTMKSSPQSSPPEDQRLEKDKYDSDNNPIESSEEEEDDDSSSSDEDSPSEVVERGRSKTVTRSSADNSEAETSTSSSPSPSTTTATTISPTSTAQSQPESNEKEEHQDTAESAAEKSDFVHSSKLGPIPKKPDVHPRTSFDASPSVPTTPFGSDDEAELSDIKRAQKLGIQMSPINSSVPNRSIRTIIRGNYTNLPEYADGSRRRRRKYMVATDLSEESVYALEWTIGTILRDGDTLFAVCAIYEETGTAPTSVPGDGAKAMQDAAAVVGSQTEETAQKPHNDSGTNLPRALLGRLGSGTDSKPGSVDARGMSKTEAERVRAVESISETCVRLLRKTLLQVRVAVEVIHCKSPKHMLTEAIDGLDPTLVIVGARGRSALKGVLLGSFSNYLVMHSSVPVMVARRKLKKHSKNKKTNIRLSNNLSAPKKLAHAKID